MARNFKQMADAINLIHEKGGQLEDDARLDLGSRFSERVIPLRRDFHKVHAAGAVSKYVAALLQQDGIDELRWIDLLHTPFESAAPEKSEKEFNCHLPIFTRVMSKADMEWYTVDLWNWYSRSDLRLFMVPRIFSKARRGLILTSSKDTRGAKRNGFNVITIDRGLLDVAICDEERPNALALDCAAMRIKNDRRFAETARSIKALFEEGEASQVDVAIARYLVTTAYYERDVLQPGSADFYYVFIPYMPRVASVISGTSVAFHALPEKIKPELFQHLEYICWAWAQYAVRIEDKRRVASSLVTTARAAIMSRNMSHNIGSHSLAQPGLEQALRLNLLVPENLRKQVRTNLLEYHQYAQARLDFIARIVGSSKETVEPMFFLSDVLGGFFLQSVLLATLLADRGYPSKVAPLRSIEFTVTVEGQGIRRRYRADDEAGVFKAVPDEIEPEQALGDVLVGVPGGKTGCHALYVFIENMMRNSVKYGSHDVTLPAEYVVNIVLRPPHNGELAKGNSAWIIEISDNLSFDDDQCGVSNKIRTHLGEGIINQHGEVAITGLGIQEMKIAADFLATGVAFAADDKLSSVDTAMNEYRRFSDGVCSPTPVSIEFESALRLLSTPLPGPQKKRRLAYHFIIKRPTLVGVLTAPSRARKATELQGPFEFVSTQGDFSSGDAPFGVILDAEHDQEAMHSLLRELADAARMLPAKTIVLTSDIKRATAWKAALLTAYGSGNETRHTAASPLAGMVVITDRALHEALRTRSFAKLPPFVGATGAEAAVLRLYFRWLQTVRRAPDGRWKVAIGFENEEALLRNSWAIQLATFSVTSQLSLPADDPTQPKLHIEAHILAKDRRYAATNGTPITEECLQDIGSSPDRPSLLVFDNHGRVFEGCLSLPPHQWPRFYQEFSGVVQMGLYNSLLHPPSSPFAFAYFMLTLVDACLCRFLIIDDRLAESALTDETDFMLYQMAGIDTVFSLYGSGNERVFLTPKVAGRVQEREEGLGSTEGLHCTKGADLSLRLLRKVDFDSVFDRLPSAVDAPYDAVIVHEGVVDIAWERGWDEDSVEKLSPVTRRVIRTSGRGWTPRHLPAMLPFVEFSEISDATYRGLNKVALGRAINALRGRPKSTS